jgi:hypothetical protein
MAVQLREVKFPESQWVVLCCSFMSFAFNSLYSYFLFLYHVLLKSIFYFNAWSSVMDLFPFPHRVPPEHVKVPHCANTTEKVLKHYGAFVPVCVSQQWVFTFLKPDWGCSHATLAVFQNLQAGLLAWGRGLLLFCLCNSLGNPDQSCAHSGLQLYDHLITDRQTRFFSTSNCRSCK